MDLIFISITKIFHSSILWLKSLFWSFEKLKLYFRLFNTYSFVQLDLLKIEGLRIYTGLLEFLGIFKDILGNSNICLFETANGLEWTLVQVSN